MDETNARQQRHWDAVADGWAAWAEWTDRNFAPVADWLARATDWRAGARVLDVASGAGFPALAAAASVGPAGTVVATDNSTAMRDVLVHRVREAHAGNIEVVQMDAEDLHFGDASFDAVTNAYGLMFSGDPQRALAESRRVLKPGGRCGVVVWAELEASSFFTLIFHAGARLLAMPLPPAGAPGPFRFASRDGLAALMRDAGFSDVSVDRVEMTLDCGTPDDYFRLFRDVAWRARLAALSDTQLAGFREALAAAAKPYIQGGRLRLAATSLGAAGSR